MNNKQIAESTSLLDTLALQNLDALSTRTHPKNRSIFKKHKIIDDNSRKKYVKNLCIRQATMELSLKSNPSNRVSFSTVGLLLVVKTITASRELPVIVTHKSQIAKENK